MTIKELYNWALENNLENYSIVLDSKYGSYNIYGPIDFELDHSKEEITLQ